MSPLLVNGQSIDFEKKFLDFLSILATRVVPLEPASRDSPTAANQRSDESPLSSLLEDCYSTKLGQREKRTTKQM